MEHRDIDVNANDHQGYTALHLACIGNDTEIVRALIGHKDININEVNPMCNFTPLHMASAGNNVDIVKALIQHKDINVNALDGVTPLARAAMNGHLDVVKLLLQDKNIIAGNAYSKAIEAGKLECAKAINSRNRHYFL